MTDKELAERLTALRNRYEDDDDRYTLHVEVDSVIIQCLEDFNFKESLAAYNKMPSFWYA